MQQVRLWEVTDNEELSEIPRSQINLEEHLEDWLENDIAVLDPNLLVIGRQVRTDFGTSIDLLCLDTAGDTVVVELKKGRTPRDVVAQVLDYASWVRELPHDRLTAMADDYLQLSPSLSLASAFEEKFEKQFPAELNLRHRSLIVAESMDASTVRIVRYLSSINVPINIATVQHFEDKSGRSMLAQVYLIEPEEAEPKPHPTTGGRGYETVSGLQALAERNDISELYGRMRQGVRGLLSAQPYSQSVGYRLRRDDGSFRTVLFVDAVRKRGNDGMGFLVHATRFNEYWGVPPDELRTWLPANSREEDVSEWVGSSKDERNGAKGLRGFFQSVEEVDEFLDALRRAVAESRRELDRVVSQTA